MGLQDRDYYRNDSTTGWTGPKSAVATLIVINVAIFLVDWIVFQFSASEFMVVRPSSLKNPLEWYRLLTCGFAHDPRDISHVAFNMFGLYVFGRAVEDHLGKVRFLAFYITAILLGSVGYAVRGLLMEFDTPMLGASGAVFAVTIHFCLRFPHQTLLFMMAIPVRAWVLGVLYLIWEIGSATKNDQIAHDVHLIGAFYGFVNFKTGWDLLNVWPSSFSNFSFRLPKRRARVKIFDPDKRQDVEREADRILEKLHREGEESLTKKERSILEDYSRRMRQKLR